MATKKRYPKSFYDDGLGDILEWIDDEVLVHSETKAKKKGRSTVGDDGDIRADIRKGRKRRVKLYGDNELSNSVHKSASRVTFELNDEQNCGTDKKLDDRVRGLVNRLTAQTMPYITSEFEKLYSSQPRTSINAAIFNTLESSILLDHAITKRKLMAELMLLVSYLSSKINQDIGASLIHRLLFKFESLYKDRDTNAGKRIDNILNCLLNFYAIGLISANVIFELAKRICSEDFRPKSVELMLSIVNSVGFQLRKDNPISMRQLIIMAQDRSKLLKSNSEISTRIEFMLEALCAIKNNNTSKLENYGCDIDRDTIQSTLKSLIKRSKLAECLADASYDEIINSPNWYLLETRVDDTAPQDPSTKSTINGDVSKSDERICKALGLSKPAEKTIFSALLRVVDYVEASNVIIRFGLNHCSDAMLVCIHVATHEKKYNPFHFNLINNLCNFNRKYKMAAKFTIQDKIRVLSRMKTERVDIFKVLCFELIKSDAVPVTILKAVEWADISSSTKEFLTYLLESISNLSVEEKSKIMSKVDKKSTFAGAMRTFTRCFLVGCKLFQ